VPLGLLQIVAVPSVGPRTAKQIYDLFQVQDVDQLDALARSGKLLGVPGFKQKTIDNIIRGIELVKRKHGNHLLGRALPVAADLCKYLEPFALRVSYGGSLRRMKEIVHDVDILAASSNPEATKAAFLKCRSSSISWHRARPSVPFA
jgi:DNA polymerase (family 10)